MTALMMYALLLVAYGLSVWSLLRQRHYAPRGGSAPMQRQPTAAGDRTAMRPVPSRARAEAA